MKLQTVKAMMVITAMLLFNHGGYAADSGYEGLLVEPAKKLSSQPLMNHEGKPVDFPVSNGHMKFVFFGYTGCPDVCPMTLQKIKKLITKLGEEADDLDFYFVSIDPQRDRTAQLKSFVSYYDPKITGITGEPRSIKALENEFGILTRRFQGKSAFAYTLEHSVFIYLLDRQGYLRVMYPASMPVSAIINDIERLKNN
jgi:protein SCO1